MINLSNPLYEDFKEQLSKDLEEVLSKKNKNCPIWLFNYMIDVLDINPKGVFENYFKLL